MERINIAWDSDRLDTYIRQNYHHRLVDFAQVVAAVLLESYWGPPFLGMTKGSAKNELERITKIKRDTVDSLRLLLRKSPHLYSYEEIEGKTEKSVVLRFNLEPFFETLDQRADELKFHLEFMDDTKGRPLEKKYKIASIWALIMKRDGKIPWANILRLVRWFHKRLEGTKYAEELWMSDNRSHARELLKNQCSRIIKKHIRILVVSMEIFFPKFARHEPEARLHSIKFLEDSVEVGLIHDGILKFHMMSFMKDKKITSTSQSKDKRMMKEPPSIIFPDGQKYSSTA